jgi:hypothetical protein
LSGGDGSPDDFLFAEEETNMAPDNARENAPSPQAGATQRVIVEGQPVAPQRQQAPRRKYRVREGATHTFNGEKRTAGYELELSDAAAFALRDKVEPVDKDQEVRVDRASENEAAKNRAKATQVPDPVKKLTQVPSGLNVSLLRQAAQDQADAAEGKMPEDGGGERGRAAGGNTDGIARAANTTAGTTSTNQDTVNPGGGTAGRQTAPAGPVKDDKK